PSTKIASNLTDTSFQKKGLSEGVTYYWRVVAKDSQNNIAVGPVWNFATRIPAPITALHALSLNNAVKLSWTQSVDHFSGEIYAYRVIVSNLAFVVMKVESTASAMMIVGGLMNGSAYNFTVYALS